MFDLKLIVSALTKKINFITIFENIIIKTKEYYDLNLSSAEASEKILNFLNSYNLEEYIIADFMELINNLVTLYSDKEVFKVQLNRFLIIIFYLKEETTNLFSMLINNLYHSSNLEYQKIYQEILKFCNDKMSIYEILIEIKKYFPIIQKIEEENSTDFRPRQ